MNKDIIKQLKRQATKLNNEIYEIEKAEIDKVQLPRIKKMVGWCMRSTYNSREEKTYRKILEWVENKEWGIYFIMEEIRLNSSGEVSIHITSESPYTNKEWWNAEIPLHGIERISEKEYEKVKAELMNEMSSRSLLRNWIVKQK